MATTFDTEREAEAVAAELNAAAGRDVRYHVERYREKWAIARQSKRTYWAWDGFPTDPPKPSLPPKISPKEVEEFRDHCVYIRSVYSFLTRIWRGSDADERNMMEAIAPSFFEDVGKVLGEYLVIAACRITDAEDAGRGKQNFTVELFANSFPPDSDAFKKLHDLRGRMEKLRMKILPARHKLGAHADRDVIRKGEPLPGGGWEDWSDFWSALTDFVRLLNEQTFGKPFEIDAGGVWGDAEMLLTSLRQSQYFEALLKSDNAAVRDACLKLALPPDKP
jgi:hypothetical protein